MSVILDALNKAQEERKKLSANMTRRLETQLPKERRVFYGVFVAVGICVALAIVIVPVLYRSKTPKAPIVTTAGAPVPANPLPVNPALSGGASEPASAVPSPTIPSPAAQRPSSAASIRPEAAKAMAEEKGMAGSRKRTVGAERAGVVMPKEKERAQGDTTAGMDQAAVDKKLKNLQSTLLKRRIEPGSVTGSVNAGKDRALVGNRPSEDRILVKKLENDKILALYNEAVREADRGNIEEAKRLYKDILAEEPGHVEALNNLGVLAMREGNSKEAMSYFRKCLLYRGNYEKAYNNMGLVMLKEGDRKQAEEYFRKAIEFDKEGVEPYLNIVSLLRTERRLEEACRLIETALSKNRREPALYLSFAILKDEMHEHKEAVRYYRSYLNAGGKKEEKVIERLKFLEENQSAGNR